MKQVRNNGFQTTIVIGGRMSRSLRNAFRSTQSGATATARVMKTSAKVVAAASTAVGAASAAGMAVATKSAVEYQDQLADTSTLLDGDVASKVSKLSKNVKSLSVVTGKTTTDMNAGLYQVVSAFGDTADSARYLEVASKAAVGGNAEIASSVSLLSSVTKGYGDTTVEATQKVSDLAFKTVKLGETTFPELAANMGKVIPIASALGSRQEELFGSMATLTGVTGNTAEVSTQLRATYQGLLQPTGNMQKALEALGYANGKAAIESEGLGDLLIKLRKLVNDDEVAFSSLFGSVEAKSAVLALTGSQAENFAKKTAEMATASGTAEAAFLAKSKTAKGLFNRLKSVGNVIAINIGEKALPTLVRMSEYLLDAFETHQPEINTFIDSVASIAGVVFPALISSVQVAWEKLTGVYRFLSGNWNKIEPIVVGVTAAFLAFKVMTSAINIAMGAYRIAMLVATAVTTGFASVMAVVTSPVFLVAAAIGLVIGAGWALYKNWDTITKGLSAFWQNNVMPVFAGIGEWFSGIFEGVVKIFKGYVNIYVNIINLIVDKLNGINIDIPDWVPGIGGETFGISIPKLPTFALGGVATGPSIFGEAGPEMAIPLKRGNRRSLDLLNQTAQMLGVSSPKGGTVEELHYHYSPVIQGGEPSKVDRVLKDNFEEFKKFTRRDRKQRRRVAFSDG